jgi:hypothetical protein
MCGHLGLHLDTSSLLSLHGLHSHLLLCKLLLLHHCRSLLLLGIHLLTHHLLLLHHGSGVHGGDLSILWSGSSSNGLHHVLIAALHCHLIHHHLLSDHMLPHVHLLLLLLMEHHLRLNRVVLLSVLHLSHVRLLYELLHSRRIVLSLRDFLLGLKLSQLLFTFLTE